MAENKKIPIEIKAIKTPLGPVPTLESLKQIVDGLNVLNEDMIRTHEIVNSEVFKQVAGIERELKSLKKLISEEAISFESIKEQISELHKRLDRIEADQQKQNSSIQDLSSLITDFIGAVRVFQERITRLLK